MINWTSVSSISIICKCPEKQGNGIYNNKTWRDLNNFTNEHRCAKIITHGHQHYSMMTFFDKLTCITSFCQVKMDTINNYEN